MLENVQCLQSSLAQDRGANHRQHCITDLQEAIKTLIKSSQELPEIFEIVLRPLWWVAGNEQPSPPLHRAAAARLLRCFDKYKSIYTRNMIANRFLVYNDLYLSKRLSQTSTMVHNHSIVGPMVHNHRKPSLPMVVLPQNHRKTIDPNGCPQPFHSMVMVTLKTIESLRWQQKSVLKVQQTQQPTLNLKIICLSGFIYT